MAEWQGFGCRDTWPCNCKQTLSLRFPMILCATEGTFVWNLVDNFWQNVCKQMISTESQFCTWDKIADIAIYIFIVDIIVLLCHFEKSERRRRIFFIVLLWFFQHLEMSLLENKMDVICSFLFHHLRMHIKRYPKILSRKYLINFIGAPNRLFQIYQKMALKAFYFIYVQWPSGQFTT